MNWVEAQVTRQKILLKQLKQTLQRQKMLTNAQKNYQQKSWKYIFDQEFRKLWFEWNNAKCLQVEEVKLRSAEKIQLVQEYKFIQINTQQHAQSTFLDQQKTKKNN